MTVDIKWRHLKKEVAWLNGSLGAARDSDVVVEYARRKRYRVWVHRMIGPVLDARQTRDHRRLVRCLRSLRFHDLIEAMSGWIERGPWLHRWQRNEDVNPGKNQPPGYRRQGKKLLSAAIAAYRDLKQAGAC